MATLELQRPKPLRPAPLSPSSSSRRLSSAPPTPCSPTIIRTPDFILLPSVPTHEPEDNLPSPMALQHQFAIAAHNDAQARRSRQGSSEDHHRMAPTASHRSDGSSSSSSSSNSNSNNHMMHDHDELEEIVEPDNALDSDPAASHDALRDVRNQQLDSLQTVVHSIAEAHFESASSPNADVTQILDDLFASLRRIGGHNAPLSPTFARSPLPSVNQMSDVDRLVLLVDRLTLAYGRVQDAQQAGLLANLNTLAQSLIASERRLARAALESPPRTPRALAAARRRRSAHSPQSSVFAPGSRSSFSSIGSYATLSTSSDEATPTPGSQVQLLEQKVSPAPAPEQQHIDGSTFDMATVRSATSRTSTFSLETLYAPQPPSALGLIHPQSPRSDQASRAASVGERSDSTALPNRKRYSVQTDSAASTALPSYDAVGKAFASQTKQRQPSESDDLPQYDPALADAGFSADVKKPVEAPTLLERRRAKLAAQHSAYAARTPEDLAMVQSSIDRLSTVMPQLDNQRVLSPDEQREAQLHHMMRRLAESSSKRLDDQRSDPPVLSAPRPAPAPPAPTPLPQLDAISELPRRGILKQSESEVPKTPTTPMSVHSASSSRRSSLLPGAFARKISIASIGNALRRASIYDTTKLKPKEVVEEPAEQAAATAAASAAASVDGDKTVRRRRAATQDSRTKSDIADGLASLFNDGKARKGSIPETNKAAQRASQSFRAIDFADDTPRGRDASLLPRASVEEEDGMLDDYSFATFDTTASNHRLSVFSDPPRSPVSWGSSRSSHVSSRRSSQLTTSDAATPTWPKSPLTPISPVASRRSPTAPSKPAVSFAADTLQPPVGARGAASLQTQLREDRSGKCAACVCASAAGAAEGDVVVYSVLERVADPLASSAQCELEFWADAHHALGCVAVLLWSTSDVDIVYEARDATLYIAPVRARVCVSSSSSSSSGGEHDHVSVPFPVNVEGRQKGMVRLEAGKVGSVKLSMCEEERVRGEEESRGVGGAGFPLGAARMAGGEGVVCGVCCARGVVPVDGAGVGPCAEGGALLEGSTSTVDAAASNAASPRTEAVAASPRLPPLLKTAGVKWRALPSEGWEELVDAWMCHADQELNRSLTETAVRFASRIHADGGQSEGETEAETVWVGDTYFLVPRRLVDESAVVFDVDGGSLQTVMRCATCRSTLGEISSPATGTSTVKLSKYMLEPCSLPQHTWMSTLLATLQHAAASHGSRRFLVQPTPCSAPGIEVWLFSRALFTTSLARHWSIAGHQTGKVWKGHRLFFRTPSAEGDAAETIELPQPVYGWLVDAMRQCNASLPRELASVLPTWSTAYLATPVGEEQS